MDRKEKLEKALSLLEEVTPQRFDCGSLCGGECCKDTSRLRLALGEDDTEMGMLLLPGEKELLERIDDFTLKEHSGKHFAVCRGRCERSYRPFACRIFPYYAKITRTGPHDTIKIRHDLRAASFCPLLSAKRKIRPSVYFMRGAKRAVRILLRDVDIRAALIAESDTVGELEDFLRAFFKNEQ